MKRYRLGNTGTSLTSDLIVQTYDRINYQYYCKAHVFVFISLQKKTWLDLFLAQFLLDFQKAKKVPEKFNSK